MVEPAIQDRPAGPRLFVIEDEWHCEHVGEFDGRDSALAEIRRLESLPWDQSPNRAPCRNWRNCGRHYHLVEFDISCRPWRRIGAEPVLQVTSGETIRLPA